MYFELYCVPVNDGFPYNVSTVVPRVFGEPLRALPLRKDRRFHEAAAEEAQRKFATVRESSERRNEHLLLVVAASTVLTTVSSSSSSVAFGRSLL